MKRIEMNPGELFAVSDRVILVDTLESVLGATSRIGTDANDQLVYFLTFEGKLNNRQEREDVTVSLPLDLAFSLLNDLLGGFELLEKFRKENDG